MPVKAEQSMSNSIVLSEVCPAELRRGWHLLCEDTNGRGVESYKRERIARRLPKRKPNPTASGACFQRLLALG